MDEVFVATYLEEYEGYSKPHGAFWSLEVAKESAEKVFGRVKRWEDNRDGGATGYFIEPEVIYTVHGGVTSRYGSRIEIFKLDVQ